MVPHGNDSPHASDHGGIRSYLDRLGELTAEPAQERRRVR